MKNILIAVFAVLAAASSVKAGEVIDFDGKKGAPLFSEMLAQAQAQTVPGTDAIIPERVFAAAPDQDELNRSLDSAISFAKTRRMSPDLVAGLECLRKTGTPEQKSAFVDGPKSKAYEFPAGCKASGQPSANKDLIDDGLQWLCESYNDVIEYLSCHKGPDGEEVCDVEIREVLRTSCDWA